MRTGYPLDVLRALRPGQRVYVQGGPGECQALYNVLEKNPGLANGVTFWSCLIPGINTFDYGALPGTHTLRTFMASPALESSIAAGRTVVTPMPYSEIARLMAETEFDAAILHVAPPDREGRCSFGLSCDMPGLVWEKAGQRIAFVNPNMPSIPGADWMPADRIDLVVDVDVPLLAASPARPRSAVIAEIAQRAAELVPDGATIQSGIGEAPPAVVAALRMHSGLKVFSGIITPEYMQLADSGALDMAATHIAGVAWGPADFQAWLLHSGFTFRPATITHDHAHIAAIDGFVSIGSALEVDLEGNLNLEWRAGRRVSSVGGAPDYIRGAAASRGGRSIIVLPATAGGASRIVPKLAAPSITGEDVDTIVTEHGVARLKGLSSTDRRRALIDIAAPEHRGFLARG